MSEPTNRAPQTLLCWHAERAGLEVLERALRALRNRNVRVERVIYLVQEGHEPEVPERVEDAVVERVALDLEDPTAHAKIYALLQQQVLPRLSNLSSALHINISPGTPAMHAVWLVLHAGGAFPEGTSIWSSQYSRQTQRVRIERVDFAISTYLAEIRRLQRTDPQRALYEPGASSRVRLEALDRLARYSRLPGAPLLVLGERGVGKTRLVETHVATLKAREKVVALPCGGLDSLLAESLLFGHRKGAFTGADSDRPGLLTGADGGILFLDEIQDLPRSTQRKLVRVFQDRQRRFRPVGSDTEVSVDVELVCASNLSATKLREQLDADLFDRLSHLTVEIPPLRECREDLEHDWRMVWREQRQSEVFPPEAPWTSRLADALYHHPLPGNLRDLQRLALLLMAWWDTDVNVAVGHAVREWSRWTTGDVSTIDGLGSGSRADRTKQFHSRLALWARDVYGTWPAAAEALDCNERTLRKDAALGVEE